MPEPSTLADTHRETMYPTLQPDAIDRLRRFGIALTFQHGETLIRAGEPGHGLSVVLAGEVAITACDPHGKVRPIVTHGIGGFVGEVAQLSGRPSLVDAHAVGAVEVLHLPPERLRALLVAEAEIGERIMRALLLRRGNLFETGTGGPMIIGRAGDGNVLRLESFLDRNAQPHARLDPEADPDGQALLDQFGIHADELPIVLCPPNGQILRNPGEVELARCLGLVGPIDPNHLYDVAVVGAGPGSPPRCTRGRKGCRSWSSTAARSAGRRGPRRGSRTTSGSRRGSAAWP